MQIIHSVQAMQATASMLREQSASIGCIPTMGALHDGHASLITASSQENTATVVSIFVNPTQFGPHEDYQRYPRTFDADVALAERHGATHVFAPSADDMYPKGFETTINVGRLSTILEGERRPGHFDGVATVVAKLFQAMLPHRAYFGQKDFQQTLVIKRMVADLNIPVQVKIQPTVREASGLAMSSRNRYLSAEEQTIAASIYLALEAGKAIVERGSRVRTEIEQAMHGQLADFDVDYAVAATAEALSTPEQFSPDEQIVLLIAARLGTTRLIDNTTI